MKTMMHISSARRKRRGTNRTSFRAAGQAIVQGLGIIALIVAIVVGIILLVTDISMTMSYQQKITYLASQGAIFYAGQSNGWQYQNSQGFSPDIQSFIQGEAQNMGLPSDSIQAVATADTDGTANISVSASNLPLIPGLSFLPGKISVQQTFNANTNLLPRPTGLLSITVYGQTTSANGNGLAGNTVLVPCYSGLAQGDQVGTRGEGDSQDPEIAGPGMYDQFSFAAPTSSGAGLSYTPGPRGMTP